MKGRREASPMTSAPNKPSGGWGGGWPRNSPEGVGMIAGPSGDSGLVGSVGPMEGRRSRMQGYRRRPGCESAEPPHGPMGPPSAPSRPPPQRAWPPHPQARAPQTREKTCGESKSASVDAGTRRPGGAGRDYVDLAPSPPDLKQSPLTPMLGSSRKPTLTRGNHGWRAQPPTPPPQASPAGRGPQDLPHTPGE